MSADIIQFIPRPNPKRELMSEELASAFGALFATEPLNKLISYEAPEKDPA